MKTTVPMRKAMVPSVAAGPGSTMPVVVFLCAMGMALAMMSLWLLWIIHPPSTTTLTALVDSALVERVLAATYWHLTHAPHGLPLPLMHTDLGSTPVDLMVVEPKVLFA